MRRIVLALIFSVALSTTGCVSTPQRTGDVAAQSSGVIPTDSLEDWVTYGDDLAPFTVKSVREGEPDPEERERKEGTISREMTISIDEPLWSRPTASGEVRLPSELTTGAGFYVFHGEDRQRAIVEGRPWLEQDEKYLGIFNFMDPELKNQMPDPGKGDPVWGPIVWMHMDDEGRVDEVFNPDEPSTKELVGKTAKEVAAVLQETEPDPKASRYMDDDPAVRYQRAYGG